MADNTKIEWADAPLTDITARLNAVLSAHFRLSAAPDDLGSVNLRSDFGADSMDLIELLMAIEDSFSISITDDEAARALGESGDQPLCGVIALVEAKLGKASNGLR